MARNRVIYQSLGVLFSDGKRSPLDKHLALFSGNAGNPTYNNEYLHIDQLQRVQSCNYSYTLNRQDIYQFGQLGRIDALAVDPPSVSADFTYYLGEGRNEKLLGFTFSNDLSTSFTSGLLANSTENPQRWGVASGKNMFIVTSDDGEDLNIDADATGINATIVSPNNVGVFGPNDGSFGTIAIGNVFVTDYSLEASVGSIPTVTVAAEGTNIRSSISTITGTSSSSGILGTEDSDDIGSLLEGWVVSGTIPSINPADGTESSEAFFISPNLFSPHTGVGEVRALKPGDITLSLGDTNDAGNLVETDDTANTACHVQSFSLSVPMSRTTLQRLGNKFGFAKEVEYPVTVTASVNALVADLKANNIFNILDTNPKHNLTITFGDGTSDVIKFSLRQAQLDGESFSAGIGDNQSVDMSFTASLGGPSDTSAGVFASGDSSWEWGTEPEDWEEAD